LDWARALPISRACSYFFPRIFPASFRGTDGAAPVYFEAAAVITTLVLLGQVLELRARQRTSGAIRALLNLAPQQAHSIAADGTERDVPLDQVKRGDGCVFVQESVFPSTARYVKARAPSTNRW